MFWQFITHKIIQTYPNVTNINEIPPTFNFGIDWSLGNDADQHLITTEYDDIEFADDFDVDKERLDSLSSANNVDLSNTTSEYDDIHFNDNFYMDKERLDSLDQYIRQKNFRSFR